MVNFEHTLAVLRHLLYRMCYFRPASLQIAVPQLLLLFPALCQMFSPYHASFNSNSICTKCGLCATLEARLTQLETKLCTKKNNPLAVVASQAPRSRCEPTQHSLLSQEFVSYQPKLHSARASVPAQSTNETSQSLC